MGASVPVRAPTWPAGPREAFVPVLVEQFVPVLGMNRDQSGPETFVPVGGMNRDHVATFSPGSCQEPAQMSCLYIYPRPQLTHCAHFFERGVGEECGAL